MAKDFGVSPITNTIYYGTVNKEKHMFTGNKEDVTDGAIKISHAIMIMMINNKEYRE